VTLATRRGRAFADVIPMHRVASVLALCCCTACVTTVELRSTIGPAGVGSEKSPEAAGVVCSPGLLAHVEQAQFYSFELGEPLCRALTKSVESSYRSARRVEKPYEGQFGRVIQFYLASSSLAVRHLPDGSTRAVYSVGVAVESRGRDLRPETRKLVTGIGNVTRSDSSTAEVVKEAAEAALQRVADDTSRLLVAGLDGPRLHGAAAGPAPATLEP
jgi:hypothetical protein